MDQSGHQKKVSFFFFFIYSGHSTTTAPMYACLSTTRHLHPLVRLGGRWGLGLTKHFKHNLASRWKQEKRSRLKVRITETERDTDCI